MRTILTFEADRKTLPLDYRPFIMSYFKGALEHEYPDIFGEFYDKNNIRIKNFSFAVYIHKPTISKDFIMMQSPLFKVYMSSADRWVMNYFFNALLKRRNHEMFIKGGNKVRLKQVDLIEIPPIQETPITIKFLSPLLVRIHDRETNKDEYIDYTHPQFQTQINENVELLCQQHAIIYTPIDLQPLQARTTVVTSMKRKMRASFGVYTLSSNLDVLNLLYLSGLGSRRGEGFGLFELVIK